MVEAICLVGYLRVLFAVIGEHIEVFSSVIRWKLEGIVLVICD